MQLNNLTDLANFLRSLGEQPNQTLAVKFKGNSWWETGFDMEFDEKLAFLTDQPCGSACCIGGWIGLLRPDLGKFFLEERVVKLAAQGEFVGPNEAFKLCYPPSNTDGWMATPLQAAFAVEILRDTGECDWDKAMELGAESALGKKVEP